MTLLPALLVVLMSLGFGVARGYSMPVWQDAGRWMTIRGDVFVFIALSFVAQNLVLADRTFWSDRPVEASPAA